MIPVVDNIRKEFYRDFTKTTLKILIIIVALLVIALALYVDNKWVLAGILAYEVLP
jgi:hypothetical protein